MSYQSKTYSLSDEVVAAIEAARNRGLTPNKYLRGLVLLAAATEAGEYTTLSSVLARLEQGSTIHVELPPHRPDDRTNLDAVGPRLSDGRGKVKQGNLKRKGMSLRRSRA